MVTRDDNNAYFSNGEFNTIGYEPQVNQPKPMAHPKTAMMMQDLVSDQEAAYNRNSLRSNSNSPLRYKSNGSSHRVVP